MATGRSRYENLSRRFGTQRISVLDVRFRQASAMRWDRHVDANRLVSLFSLRTLNDAGCGSRRAPFGPSFTCCNSSVVMTLRLLTSVLLLLLLLFLLLLLLLLPPPPPLLLLLLRAAGADCDWHVYPGNGHREPVRTAERCRLTLVT